MKLAGNVCKIKLMHDCQEQDSGSWKVLKTLFQHPQHSDSISILSSGGRSIWEKKGNAKNKGSVDMRCGRAVEIS